MGKKVDEFNAYRKKMNEKILSEDNLQIKRFFNLDSQAYAEGALPAKTKELLGLACSGVLRCDDCIAYHLIQCHEQRVDKAALLETLNVVLVVGGSITIPHIRRAMEVWEELESDSSS